MKNIIKHFVVWLVIGFSLYAIYNILMARSLGIERSFQIEDYIEGLLIAAIFSILTTVISITLINKLKKN